MRRRLGLSKREVGRWEQKHAMWNSNIIKNCLTLIISSSVTNVFVNFIFQIFSMRKIRKVEQ